MLGRVAARSLRSHVPSPYSPKFFPATPARTFAKHNKPKQPLPVTPPFSSSGNRHGPQAQRPSDALSPSVRSEADASALEHAIRSELANISKLQGEVDEIQRPSPKRQDELQTSVPSDNSTFHQSGSPSAIDPTETQRQLAGQQQARPLPDLRQGIPPTFGVEMASAFAKSDPASLNITEDPAQAGGRGGGDLPKEAYISSLERKRNRWANWFYASTLLSVVVGSVFLGRNWETEEEERKHPDAPSGWGFGLFYNRAGARLRDTLDYYNEPAFPKLLPDTQPEWERPYTLVLSLEDLLVSSEWSREHGWRIAKRPGVDYFLRYLSQYYELVIFTSVPSMIGHPIIQKLDPYRIVMWPLFREATRYQKGQYVKDLSFLNRDLKKVILLDTVSAHAKLQPENAIIVPKWKGDTNDKGLVSYIPFFEYLASMQFDDAREVLKSFEGKDIPTEFSRREAVLRERFQQQIAGERAKRPRRSMGGLSKVLKPQGFEGEPSLSEEMEQGKMMLDILRERGQKTYEMLEKEIRDNGEKWLKEMADEEKKAADDAMKGMKSSITNMFPFGGGSGKTA